MAETVPSEWTEEVLRDHVAEIVFDASEQYEPDCVLCQKAQAAGLFDPYGDPLDSDGQREGE